MMLRFLTTQALALGLLVAPLFGANDKNFTYLALGDSIAFGYDPTVAVPAPDKYVGYPEKVAQMESINEVNAACPGETSGSFLKVNAPDNGCNGPHGFKATIGLHTKYNEAQVSFAISELASNKHINLVTLSIGGNDLLLLQQQCVNSTLGFTGCVEKYLPGVLATYGQHLFDILATIRAHYKGTLIVMTSYAPNTDPLFALAIGGLNSEMVGVGAPFGVKFADAFDAFYIASLFAHGDPCAAGLLIRLPKPGPNGSCDVHPSPIGRDVLAGTVLLAH
jgi:lysophospholipase L1-like esterase